MSLFPSLEGKEASVQRGDPVPSSATDYPGDLSQVTQPPHDD